jgi:amidase
VAARSSRSSTSGADVDGNRHDAPGAVHDTAPAASASAGWPGDDLCRRTASDLAALLHAGQVSAREVVTAHLDRLAQVDGRVNAVVTVTAEQAVARARELDETFAHDGPVGPLHGLPVAHKDLFATRGVRTTSGSLAFQDNVPTIDALHVARMRDAGGISLGKTNTPEFGAGSQTTNKLFGATRNPYDLAQTSGGSSGGSAAALASRTVALADGSDMGGSLRNPASFCNVVGLRPTPGRAPVWPTDDPWSPMSVVGPMGRTVRDVALLLDVMAGPDPLASLALGVPAGSFTAGLDGARRAPGGLSGVRVAWSRDLGGLPVEPAVTAVLEPARAVLTELGCRVADDEPDLTGADEAFSTLRAIAFATAYGPLLEPHRAVLKQTVIWNIEAGLALTGDAVARATRLRGRVIDDARRFFQRYDVLCAPVSQVPPFDVDLEWVREIDGTPMSTYIEWMGSCCRITVLGTPALSVPAGFTPGGLPVGLQLVARAGDEARLLQVAAAFEAATGYGAREPDLTT